MKLSEAPSPADSASLTAISWCLMSDSIAGVLINLLGRVSCQSAGLAGQIKHYTVDSVTQPACGLCRLAQQTGDIPYCDHQVGQIVNFELFLAGLGITQQTGDILYCDH